MMRPFFWPKNQEIMQKLDIIYETVKIDLPIYFIVQNQYWWNAVNSQFDVLNTYAQTQ